MRKILLLGSGFVARPCAEYVVRDPSNELTIACRTLKSAQALADGLPNAKCISLDVNSANDLEAQVAAHDLVISLIPYTYHPTVIKAAIKAKVHVVTTSYVSPAMHELDEEAKKAGIVVMNEIGLDPGIDHLYAIKTIDEVHAKGGKVSLWYFRSLRTALTCLHRSSNSCPTVVVSQRQSARVTLSATSSRGHLVVSSLPCSIQHPTSPRASSSMFLVMS